MEEIISNSFGCGLEEETRKAHLGRLERQAQGASCQPEVPAGNQWVKARTPTFSFQYLQGLVLTNFSKSACRCSMKCVDLH